MAARALLLQLPQQLLVLLLLPLGLLACPHICLLTRLRQQVHDEGLLASSLLGCNEAIQHAAHLPPIREGVELHAQLVAG
jgi:hypothetical protein